MDFGKIMTEWANETPSVSALILIGSRERNDPTGLEAADSNSDWDFQIITSRPETFSSAAWTKSLRGVRLIAYGCRYAQIGAVPKINALFDGVEADFVIIPFKSAIMLRIAVAMGVHRKKGRTQNRIRDLAEVIRPGWKFLKGGSKWGSSFQQIVNEVSDPRMDDDAVRMTATVFFCDFVWCTKKISRGEFRAAQRIVYQELEEAILRLLHELRRRRGEPTFTKARRLERILRANELDEITIVCEPNKISLLAAIEKAAVVCRSLTKELVGDSWQWPFDR